MFSDHLSTILEICHLGNFSNFATILGTSKVNNSFTMVLRCLILLPIVFAQIPPQPVVTTNSACLNGCLQQGSLVFAANNLRNYQKIVLSIEQFCDTYEQLIKCGSQCSEEDRQNLDERLDLVGYICKDKFEEFQLIKDCMQTQEIDHVNRCASTCGHAQDAVVQLDSTPAAPVNPFLFIDSIAPVCNKLECIIKCSITENNKRCAGSGDIFRDIGFRQVIQASERLHDEAFNSTSSVTQQLAKIYLEELPEPCIYIIDPIRYDTLFAMHNNDNDDEKGSEMATVAALNSEITFSTIQSTAGMTDIEHKTTPPTFIPNSADVVTRIFDVQIEKNIERSTASTSIKETQRDSESVTETTKAKEEVDDASITDEITGGSSAIDSVAGNSHEQINQDTEQVENPTHTDIQSIGTESKQSSSSAEEATMPKTVENTDEKDAKIPDFEHEHMHEIAQSSEDVTSRNVISKMNDSEEVTEENNSVTTTQGTTERMIMVVNEESENEREIDMNNIRHDHHDMTTQQTDAGVLGTYSLPLLTVLLASILC